MCPKLKKDFRTTLIDINTQSVDITLVSFFNFAYFLLLAQLGLMLTLN